jgi:MFS family permease
MKRKHWILLLLSLLSVITFLDRNALSISGIHITKELALSESQFGWILAAFTFSYGLFEIPMGIWGDRLGEKGVITKIVLGWSIFTSLTGLAFGFYSLFAIRFLFGIGEAGAYPNASIAVRKWFVPLERGRAQAVIWMSSRLGGAITPLMVVPLQMYFGWRLTFLVLGIIGLIWVVVWALLYQSPVGDDNVAPLTKETGGSLKSVIQTRNFWLLMIMYYCYASGVFFFISWLPKYLHQGRGIPENELTYMASLPFLLAAFGCLFGGAISDVLVKKIGLIWGRRIVPLTGLLLSGLVMLGASVIESNNAAVLLLALGLAFMDFTAPVAWAIATGLGKESAGAVTGAMNTAGLLGGTIASLGIGYLITWTGSYEIPVMIIGIQLLFGSAICLGIKAES